MFLLTQKNIEVAEIVNISVKLVLDSSSGVVYLRNNTVQGIVGVSGNIYEKELGPYSISDPNDKLLELVNIDISGLDRIFGTQIGFQIQSDDGITQTEWKIYNSMSKLILSWKVYN